jgi:hypothetical protein
MEGRWLIQWAIVEQRRWPELARLAHVPNGGARSKVTAAILKAEGVRSGYPDYVLDVPRGGYHGLRIELKADDGRASDEQCDWLAFLHAQGYAAFVCVGWRRAAHLLLRYMSLHPGASLGEPMVGVSPDQVLHWLGELR